MKILLKQGEVSFEETPELKEEVYQRVLAWYVKHDSFLGESIMQSDNPQIDAPVFLSDLADDVFKFKYKHDEE